MDFTNKTVLISGGSRGIGRAAALAFAKAGANIAVIYASNSAAAQDLCARAREYTKGTDNALCIACDVCDFQACAAAVNETLDRFGTIDVLVNNAGITRDNLMLKMSEEDFDRVISVNLKGCFNLIKHTTKIFVKKRAGRIINISSVSGIMGNAGQSNYAAAKAGIIALTKSIAKELASRSITCNAIAPGFIKTDMSAAIGQQALEKALESIPAARFGAPEEVASLVMFLASDAASYITGEVIKIDGGLYI